MNKILIIFIIFVSIFLSSCETIPEKYSGACELMDNKISWYKSLVKVEKNYGVDMSTILAFIKQESSFNAYARPPIKKVFFDLIPVGRKSSSYGFSQAKNSTWDWYRKKSGDKYATRTNFYDSSNFIAWYILQTKKLSSIYTNDVYHQYLAYHEGHNGFNKQSYNSKPWLKDVAKKVALTAKYYKSDLRHCRAKLNSTYFWSYF